MRKLLFIGLIFITATLSAQTKQKFLIAGDNNLSEIVRTDKLKKRYGDDVMISTPDPRYPKAKELHSSKFSSAQEERETSLCLDRGILKKLLEENLV